MSIIGYGHKESGKVVKDGTFELPDMQFEPTATIADMAKAYSRAIKYTDNDGSESVVTLDLSANEVHEHFRKNLVIFLQGKGRPAAQASDKVEYTTLDGAANGLTLAITSGNEGRAQTIVSKYPACVRENHKTIAAALGMSIDW